MARTENTVTTLVALFRHAVAAEQRALLNYKRGGQWQSVSARELEEQVRAVAMGLYALGVRAGDRVGLLAENRVEWTIADLGILNCGAASVPIYATQAPKQVGYILNDAGVEILFISTQAQYERVREALSDCPKLRVIIAFDPLKDALSLSDLQGRGSELQRREPHLYEALRSSVTPATLATIIYTSGTTGEPKGVVLTHHNLVTNVLANFRNAELTANDTALTFLPFSHILERTTIYMYLYARLSTYLAESVEAVPQNLREVRPHFMTSVPRLFEKMYAKTLEQAAAGGKTKAALAAWAFAVGREWAQIVSNGGHPGALLNLKHKLADVLVFAKWRAALGGRIRALVSGGAPLAPEIARVFYGAGLPIYQGYGLTESSPTITCNTPRANRLGSVGRAIPGVLVRIAEDGEILAAGPNIMQGYYNRPAETEATLTTDAEGRTWLHTGDIGHLDQDDYLYITDRKKDLLKTSGGKYIAPQPIENAIKQSRFVNQVIVIGDQRKFPAALIVPQMDALKSYAALKNIPYREAAELLRQPQIIDLFERQVAKFTSELAQFEQIKAIALLPQEMTIEGGELTPTLKVKRRVVTDKYKELIDRLYTEKAERKEQHAAH